MNKIKCCCIICKREISTSNIDKHYHSCKNKPSKIKYATLTKCLHCNTDITNLSGIAKFNHHKHCVSNHSKHDLKLTRDHISNESIDKMRSSVSIAHKDGKYADAYIKIGLSHIGKRHSEKSKAKMRESALNNTYQRKCKSSHAYIDKSGRHFIFDSSWEDILANRLDFLDIQWERPNPIQYKLNGKTRNYFPDFYLPEHDLYLDPKNEWVRTQQKDKLEIVSKLINLRILNLDECKSFRI